MDKAYPIKTSMRDIMENVQKLKGQGDEKSHISINHLSLNRQIKRKGVKEIDEINFIRALENFDILRKKLEKRKLVARN